MTPIKITVDGQSFFIKAKDHNAYHLAQAINTMGEGVKAEQIKNEKSSANAVAEFHRQRGCCDGSDPVKCWNDRNAELDRVAAERKAEREREAKARRNPRSEYEGCE